MRRKQLTRDTILQTLEQLRPELEETYKVRDMGLFGSYVRGTEKKDESDIDVLVVLSDDADLLDLVRLWQFLEDAFGREVDVVTKDALREEFKDEVLREVVTW